MKKILITGADSYVGTQVEKWLLKYTDDYYVKTIDVKDETWNEYDFSMYDAVLHVAGIAHVKETKKNRELFFSINRDLTYKVACKAKQEGVKQFIFISSMSVYGLITGVIDNNTIEKPNTAYGKSKLEAEKLIKSMENDDFIITILRPPMIYGKGCKGNYNTLRKIALTSPIFPKIDNKRSMIFIDNFCLFIKKILDNKLSGTFFPQNSSYVNTSEMVKFIATVNRKRILLVKWMAIVSFLPFKNVKKAFGTFIYKYENKQNLILGEDQVYNFKESIWKTEL